MRCHSEVDHSLQVKNLSITESQAILIFTFSVLQQIPEKRSDLADIKKCHPRQADRLGTSSAKWGKLHEEWIKSLRVMSWGFAREKIISIIIGAGFSAPVGYPIGNRLNHLLLNSKNENIGFPSEGSLAVNSDGSKPVYAYKSSHQIDFEFCCQLMDHYTTIFKEFDYEKFFDYVVSTAFWTRMLKKLQNHFSMGPNQPTL